MPVPDFQSMMLPILTLLNHGNECAVRELTSAVATHFNLTEQDRAEKVPSGTQFTLANRVAWAKAHLGRAGLIDNPSRGRIRIADAGRQVLAERPDAVNCRYLKRFPSYLRFIGQSDDAPSNGTTPNIVALESVRTPQELIESSVEALHKATAADLRERLQQCSPGFFEIVVVRVLQALGYGATGEALVTGKSGDGGIDGIIKEDKLGLDVVCVQAKRWEATVGRPTVQAFVGSMDYVRAKKGVVITTAGFSREAVEYVDRIEGKKVVLIDGGRLAALMIEYGVGVNTTKRYELKEDSNDFFDEDEG